jgi:vacuolar-type H+-ATPase subunit H
MAEEFVGPEYLTTRGIPSSRRGYDKRVVDAVLSEARGHWQALLDRYTELRQLVESTGGIEFLGKELSEIGRDVGEVLASAQQAAEGIRNRSHQEAERIEREASEEAEAVVAEAERQAFDLRSSAWDDGMDLIQSIEAEGERIIQAAKDSALLIRAQAEKDAHRHIAGAEREASDLVRQARYEADRQLNQARELAQTIIDRAAAPAFIEPGDTVQVRDPGVERRRDEILGEIERIRLQQNVDSVAVFENEPKLPEPDARPYEPDGIDLSDVLAAEVGEMRGEPDEVIAPDVPNEPEVVTVSTTPPGPRHGTPDPAHDLFGTDDDVGTLFEALRTTGEQPQPIVEEQLPADPFELRDQLLSLVVDDAARETKRRIVDLQNEALAGLRSTGWEPNPPTVARELGRSLEPLILKAASAGATAAGPLADLRGAIADPGTRASQVVAGMAASLAGQLAAAVEDASNPELAAEAVSRVFRVWRNDEAERWVENVAGTAYHDSLLSAMRAGGIDKVQALVGSDPACAECPGPGGLSWRPGREPPDETKVPPASITCTCAVVPAG